MKFSAAYNTDIGIRKSTNQDSAALRVIDTNEGEVAFGIVCDGMGGLSKGELASKEVLLSFCQWFDENFADQIAQGTFHPDRLRNEWNDIIQMENQKLGAYGAAHNIMLGTTVSAVLMFGNAFYICHVGDSRVYELTDRVRILTKDQTFVAREIAAGRMTPEEARTDPRRNVLLQCVGASSVVTPDFLNGQLRSNAVYFICSDGFRHQISNDEILEKMGPYTTRNEEDLHYGCTYLTELAKNRQEVDNITVVAFHTF